MKKPMQPRPPKLTDAERHKRFVEMAHKLDIPDDADVSPEFFKRLVRPAPIKTVPPAGRRK
jgi:hypothetical protein